MQERTNQPKQKIEYNFDITTHIRLVPPFQEKEVDKYFLHFEKVAENLNWPKEHWTLLLQSVLIGKACEIYTQLAVEQIHHYETVKELTLKGYELVPEAYRQKFWNCKKDSNQTHVEFARNKEQLFGIGAVLLQEDNNGIDHQVCYFSKKFNKHQKNYSTIEKECLALILAIQQFEVYLTSSTSPIVVFSDHNPLSFLHKLKNKNQRLLRWSLLLQEFNLDIRNIKGKDNIILDALSRVWNSNSHFPLIKFKLDFQTVLSLNWLFSLVWNN